MNGTLPPDDLRATLLARTRGVVRRRRRVRQAAFAALVPIVYAGGFLSARLLEPRAESSRGDALAAVQETGADAPQPIAPRSAAELELVAEIAGDEERRALLLSAGDAYLAERGDIERALRCYRAYLNETGAAAPSSREESWLLTALRQNRL